MAVTSVEIGNSGAPKKHEERQRTRAALGMSTTLILAGLLSLCIGWPAWLVGAWYSLKGWVLGMNLVYGVLGLPGGVALPVGWWALSCIVLGGAYSFVEIRLRPGRALYKQMLAWLGWPLLVVLFLLWVLVIATDVGSTFLSVLNPPANAWPMTKQLASNGWASFAWSLVLTFVPEGFIILGGILIRKGFTWTR